MTADARRRAEEALATMNGVLLAWGPQPPMSKSAALCHAISVGTVALEALLASEPAPPAGAGVREEIPAGMEGPLPDEDGYEQPPINCGTFACSHDPSLVCLRCRDTEPARPPRPAQPHPSWDTSCVRCGRGLTINAVTCGECLAETPGIAAVATPRPAQDAEWEGGPLAVPSDIERWLTEGMLTYSEAEAIRATLRSLLARVAERESLLHECNAVCLCGCPASEHESYGEDGESCGRDDHECIRVPKAVLTYVNMLRSRHAELSRDACQLPPEVEAADPLTVYCDVCEADRRQPCHTVTTGDPAPYAHPERAVSAALSEKEDK